MPFGQFEQPPKGAEKKLAYAESYGEAKEEPMRVAFETKEGEKFFAETLTDPEDPRVEKAQAMLVKRFGKEEVDPIEVMKEAMTGRMETGEECPRYLVTVVENDKGEVVAMASGAAVELVNKLHDVSRDKAVLLDAYTVVSPELQKKGVDEHLFEMRERAALQDAEKRGLKLVGYVVEDGGKDEEMYNRYGARRAYHEKGGYGKANRFFEEVRYSQPPVDWNKKTGEPTRSAGIVPEHLMVKLFPQESWVDKETLAAMVRGMFLYNNEREREYFTSPRAYQTHLRFLKSMEKEFVFSLMSESLYFPGRQDIVLLMNKELRERNKNQGTAKFLEHKSEEDLVREKKARVHREKS